MISWSYYGERAAEYLFGRVSLLPYRILFTLIVMIGPILSLSNILDFSDIMLLSMAFPNIIGLIILSPKVGAALKDYRQRMSQSSNHRSLSSECKTPVQAVFFNCHGVSDSFQPCGADGRRRQTPS